tara:strand:+ start:1037 stop:1585 length:549 start_codon:yes stop_codon:yes gene_type:complete
VIVVGIVLLAGKNGSKIQVKKVLKKFRTDGMPKANYPKKNTKNKNELLILKIKTMGYYFNKTLNEDFDKVIERVTEELEKEGFGILTEIDVKETLKKKLDVDFKKYRILGACNPPYAHQALEAEDKIGAMLPCNVIVQEVSKGNVEVAAVNPMASMQAVDNEILTEIASDITAKLENVIDKL